MRVLVVTDAWHPQINGVVHTLLALAKATERLGSELIFLTPEGFPTVPLPSYPEIRLALPNPRTIQQRINEANADAVHIVTEGPMGLAARRCCLMSGRSFSTSFHTRFPEYLSARIPFPECWTWAWLRWFHAAGTHLMAPTPTMAHELARRGFANLKIWPSGVDAERFRPRSCPNIKWSRPIFLSVGRVAVEKNLPAFLSLDLPGTKIIVGDGPARADLMRRFPRVIFLGVKKGEELAEIFAAADVFVFPSRTDVLPLALLEALASGLPIAAFPVSAPHDVIGQAPVGILDNDLKAACLQALSLSRETCRVSALQMTWEASAKAFLNNVSRLSSIPTVA